MVNRDLENYIEILDCKEFFDNLTSDEMTLLKSKMVIHQYRKGQVLFFYSDPKVYSFFLLSGLVRLERTDVDADNFYIDYINEDTYFPYSSVFGETRYQHTATAVTDIDIILIPNEVFEKIVSNNINQLMYMYRKMANTLNFLETRIQVISVHNTKLRVKKMLSVWMFDLSKAKHDIRIIPYPLTINELAYVSGTTRETAGRVVRELSEEGKIDFRRQAIYYLDVDYFEQMLEWWVRDCVKR